VGASDGSACAYQGEIVILASDTGTFDSINNLVKQQGGQLIGYVESLGFYHAKFDITDYVGLDSLAQSLEENPLVSVAMPNVISLGNLSASNIDPLFPDMSGKYDYMWWQDVIELPAAQQLIQSTPHQTINIGVSDSCLWYDHPALMIPAANVYGVAKNDIAKNPSDKNYGDEVDENNHGTMVTGIISAKPYESSPGGIVNDCNIFFHNYNDSSTDDPLFRDYVLSFYNPSWDTVLDISQTKNCLAIAGTCYSFAWLAQQDCDFINASYDFGVMKPKTYDAASRLMSTFLKNLFTRYTKLLVIAAAGNEGKNAIKPPSSQKDATKYNLTFAGLVYITPSLSDHIIVVGATNLPPATYSNEILNYYSNSFRLDNYSNTGAGVNIAAPGSFIYTTAKADSADLCINDSDQYGNSYYIATGNNLYAVGVGTSLAAPIVTGVAALVKQANPQLDAKGIKDSLISSGSGHMIDGQYPFVNARAAVEQALQRAGKDTSATVPSYTPGDVQTAQNGNDNAATDTTSPTDTTVATTAPTVADNTSANSSANNSAASTEQWYGSVAANRENTSRFNLFGGNEGRAAAAGSYVLYNNPADSGCLYMRSVDGTVDERLVNVSNACYINADQEMVYFSSLPMGEGGGIYSYNLQTKELWQLTSQPCSKLQEYNGYLYFVQNNIIYKMAVDGTGLTAIYSQYPVKEFVVNPSDGNIYIFDNSGINDIFIIDANGQILNEIGQDWSGSVWGWDWLDDVVLSVGGLTSYEIDGYQNIKNPPAQSLTQIYNYNFAYVTVNYLQGAVFYSDLQNVYSLNFTADPANGGTVTGTLAWPNIKGICAALGLLFCYDSINTDARLNYNYGTLQVLPLN